MNKPALVVMAAGMGSRFGGLKQMAPVDDYGNSLLHYSIYDALQAGFGKVIFIIKGSIEEDFRKLTENVTRHASTAYVMQETSMLPPGFAVPEGRTRPWGTGHAVLCAARELDVPFGVINADDFYGRGAYELIAGFLGRRHGPGDYAMVGYRLKNVITDNGAVTRGICRIREGRLEKITEQPGIYRRGCDGAVTEDGGATFRTIPGDTVVSMNFWGYQPDYLRALQERFPVFLAGEVPENPQKSEFFLPKITDAMLRENRCTVEVLETEESWHGVTYREDLPAVQEAIARLHREGAYPQVLFP